MEPNVNNEVDKRTARFRIGLTRIMVITFACGFVGVMIQRMNVMLAIGLVFGLVLEAVIYKYAG